MNYKATITTLTPVHLGTGQELLTGYDLFQDKQRDETYRLKIDAILDHALGDDTQFNNQILQSRPEQLVTLEELRQPASEFATYALKGQPKSGQVKEQIKDVWGRLYLPGSSLKGALRTVIGRNLANQEGIRARLQVNFEGNDREADDQIDGIVFGKTPERDILRVLRVADSRPVETNPVLINVSVIKGKEPQTPIDVEAIPSKVSFETSITVEDYLSRENRPVTQKKNTGQWGSPAEKLDWQPDQIEWLNDLEIALPIFGRNMALVRIKQELAYYRRVGLNHLASLYSSWHEELKGMRQSSTFLLQLGWAGGWDSKTLGRELIARDETEFAAIRQRFQLGKPPQHKDKWQARPGDRFPTSRRLRVDDRHEPVEPLGWVKITIEK